MLNIFILEDDFLQQSRIETVIKDVISKKSLKCKGPEIYGKPSQLLDAITERGSHQLFFLDIEIKGEEKKGLDIAKEIRKKDPNATIVFVTTHSEFMPVTFKYRVAALDFIDKALNDEFFYERVRLAIEYTMDKLGATIAQDSFTFETSMAHVQVPFNNILFLKRLQQYIRLFCILKKKEWSFTQVFQKLSALTNAYIDAIVRLSLILKISLKSTKKKKWQCLITILDVPSPVRNIGAFWRRLNR